MKKTKQNKTKQTNKQPKTDTHKKPKMQHSHDEIFTLASTCESNVAVVIGLSNADE